MKKKRKSLRKRPVRTSKNKRRGIYKVQSDNQRKKRKYSPFMIFLIVIMSAIIIIGIIVQLKHIYLHISGKGGSVM